MITSIWGVEGCGKTSVALTFPTPLFHMDLDLGGFERASWRLDPNTRIYRAEAGESLESIDFSKYDIVSKPYVLPIEVEKLEGLQAKLSGGQVKKDPSVRFPRRVMGVKEVWQEVVLDYIQVCKMAVLQTIVLDSATQLWTICHRGLLQEKQEIQLSSGVRESDGNFREKLLPVEFPNERMRTLIYTARSFQKNLVMTHYPKDVYAERVGDKGIETYRTGEVTPDGFKDTIKLVDIVLRLRTEKNAKGVYESQATIDIKCGLPGLGMTAIGQEVYPPTYQGLMDLQKRAMGKG